MGRPERKLDPESGPIAQFASDLRALRAAAGGPAYWKMARRCGVSRSALAEATGGRQVPSWRVVAAFVGVCGGDLDAWRPRWESATAAATAMAAGEIVEVPSWSGRLAPLPGSRVVPARRVAGLLAPRYLVAAVAVTAVALAGVVVASVVTTRGGTPESQARPSPMAARPSAGAVTGTAAGPPSAGLPSAGPLTAGANLPPVTCGTPTDRLPCQGRSAYATGCRADGTVTVSAAFLPAHLMIYYSPRCQAAWMALTVPAGFGGRIELDTASGFRTCYPAGCARLDRVDLQHCDFLPRSSPCLWSDMVHLINTEGSSATAIGAWRSGNGPMTRRFVTLTGDDVPSG